MSANDIVRICFAHVSNVYVHFAFPPLSLWPKVYFVAHVVLLITIVLVLNIAFVDAMAQHLFSLLNLFANKCTTSSQTNFTPHRLFYLDMH